MSFEVEKDHLRQVLKRDRMSLTENERRIAQAAICSAILDFCDAYVHTVTPGAKRHTIGLYAAVRAEVDVLDCVSSLRERGWIVAYPKVLNASGQMDMFVVDSPVDLTPGQFGILEPSAHASVLEPADLDILLVPGLGFTLAGWRLGYGGGFYDRYLSRTRPELCTVGIAFRVQLRDALPISHHDQRLKYLITEQGVVDCWK
ncbi:5-formyltetrahydrofolate cyclo-ligase [Alicyclobacillus fastidiosus]|uniref:5-formyltetrahydrofolate cyclo-ligase n=1 Tax=Alicyclobacillus fastidiosus TaxID=392011 RepID=A0ABY6ZGE4_9BACL|nr:5-formyltetrahydrofolate cyclo-ligase [Alicyclobacillus fastidiosus]WAH41658.1 5-formyltetrahydrofolate cyclo-ligase [Alicyclobacillus fastidiosus]GMA63336.1 5-formyltetrahydrofolate cyclo-ligase [Alicyclobacillus fastidiosus]